MTLAMRAVRRLAQGFDYELARAVAPEAACIDLMARLRERMRRGGEDAAPFLQFDDWYVRG